MKSEELEKQIQKIHFETDPALREQILRDASCAQAEAIKKNVKPSIWRTIMKTKAPRYAAAAVILVVVGGLVFLERFVTPAWAIERSIEQLRQFNALYMEGKGQTLFGVEGDLRIWARADEKQQESAAMKIAYGEGKVAWVDPQENRSYTYDPAAHQAKYRPGKVFQMRPWLGAELLEILQREADDWNIVHGVDAATGRERAYVTCRKSGDPMGPFDQSWWFEFDEESGLLVAFKQWRNANWSGQPEMEVSKIVFFEDLPDSALTFEIPADAHVAEKTDIDLIEEMPRAFTDAAREVLDSGFVGRQDDTWRITAEGYVRCESRIVFSEVPDNADILPLALPYREAKVTGITLDDRTIDGERVESGRVDALLAGQAIIPNQSDIVVSWEIPFDLIMGNNENNQRCTIMLQSMTATTHYRVTVVLDDDCGYVFIRDPSADRVRPFNWWIGGTPRVSFGNCSFEMRPVD